MTRGEASATFGTNRKRHFCISFWNASNSRNGTTFTMPLHFFVKSQLVRPTSTPRRPNSPHMISRHCLARSQFLLYDCHPGSHLSLSCRHTYMKSYSFLMEGSGLYASASFKSDSVRSMSGSPDFRRLVGGSLKQCSQADTMAG